MPILLLLLRQCIIISPQFRFYFIFHLDYYYYHYYLGCPMSIDLNFNLLLLLLLSLLCYECDDNRIIMMNEIELPYILTIWIVLVVVSFPTGIVNSASLLYLYSKRAPYIYKQTNFHFWVFISRIIKKIHLLFLFFVYCFCSSLLMIIMMIMTILVWSK